MRGKIKSSLSIGIDLMGSDAPARELLEIILLHYSSFDDPIYLTLFGTSEVFQGISSPSASISFFPVQEAIYMHELPLVAIKRKPNSSLCVGICMLKKGHLHAFISAGNTGALMSSAKIHLSSLSGLKRPALLTLFPGHQSEIALLDVGASISYKATHLVHFAAMGIAYQKSRGIACPKLALLNIGSEAKKGTPELRDAYQTLQHLSDKNDFIFIGNVEARNVFQTELDVLITDGFTGNIFLKTSEGIAFNILKMIGDIDKETHSLSLQRALHELHQKLDYSKYPGALLAGIDKIIIKCHGEGSSSSILSSINNACQLIKYNFIDKVKEQLQSLLFSGKRT
ncbi:MAG: phosphate acyltransferase PlsX [Chlamydiae bacterium]|nr:MAG: phosphate acyltransferase PlsX [Chlamydiota bacterium]